MSVQNGVVATPDLRGTILPGITRKSVIQLAQNLGHTVSLTAHPSPTVHAAMQH